MKAVRDEVDDYDKHFIQPNKENEPANKIEEKKESEMAGKDVDEAELKKDSEP